MSARTPGPYFPVVNRSERLVIRHTNEDGWLMTLGGESIPAVRSVRFSAGVNEVTAVEVEFFPGGVEIEADVDRVRMVPTLWWPGMPWRVFWRNLKAWARYRWICMQRWAWYRWEHGW